MENSIFYKNVKCVYTNEGISMFAQQSSGPKISKIGAVLFKDVDKVIENEYLLDNELNTIKYLKYKNVTDYLSLIYSGLTYNIEGNILTPVNVYEYNFAYTNINRVFPINVSYCNDEIINENDEISYDKYISYDLLISPNQINTNNKHVTIDFDGFIIVGLPHKSIEQEYNSNLLKKQNFCSIALVYFPDKNEKLQIVAGQPDIVCMNIETHIHMQDPILLNNLKYIYEDIELPKPERFVNGLHIVNNSLHDRG